MQFEFKFDNLPITTVHQSRLQMFQPSRRPKEQRREIATPWGTATVVGKIGQGHADLLEAICNLAADFRLIEESGQMQVLVDPYKVRMAVGGGKQAGYAAIWRMIEDLKRVAIDMRIETPTERNRIMGGVLDQVEESTAKAPNPLGGERSMWRVTFNVAFVKLMGTDLHLHYDPAKIATLQTGIAQAIARHVLTHRDAPNGGWHIDNLIRAVGEGKNSTAMRHRRRELGEDAEGLRTLGFAIEDGRLKTL